MQNLAIVRLMDDALVWYPPGAGEQPRPLGSAEEVASFAASLRSSRWQACFAAPGADVRLLSLEVTAAEKKHLARALPFMFEEQVAEDVDALHFASRALDKTRYAVALCSHRAMAYWAQRLAHLPDLPRWVPETLLLPWRAGEWCLVMDGEQVLVRSGEAEGYTVECELLPVVLAAAAEAELPETIIFYAADHAAALDLLPALLRERVQWRQGNLCSALLLSADEAALSLRQGAYASRLPLVQWWNYWRVAAGFLLGAFVLQLAATWADYRALASENLALRGALETSYRQAVPQGALVDAERQLQRQLDSLRGGPGAGSFVPLLERAGRVIAERPATRVLSLNYNQRGGEMRLNIVASDFSAVEQLRAGLTDAGLAAEMESSSAQGDGVRARIRVRGA
ncbi:MAG TPA: type II secretion system protein GspL [Halieaceae bacterium]|uniref:type II secretion system protein GspL n=1 Tax=Haliea TaxID=475794 RepID=UPI0003FEB83C|nr:MULTISPECIES: type II secretion system protein GspL [Haliea]HBM83407.1 type II secretion system protein GspL [Halieaceae bacterium]MAY92866.1 type II secretion system protein GspL [Haliea sp.]MBK40353.1 type II secretion system protein GspL [Haliea sp.]MBP68930.1 type II secretion system protein GspL [Haliea sp.]HBQ41543.1 type II secretion system protein GspL [Halieaceae bacterium]